MSEDKKQLTYWDSAEPNICPICGKKFIPAPENYWKIGKFDFRTRTIDVCSYTCMRKWEKEKLNGNKRYMTIEK